ncbi:MAG TPA: TlpA disulfide reductase family protein [Candidatus Acidoferrum sp.]|nr:TlpA disulfide reductase family protein [Candidatus Acidoferrum sp.]
MHRKRGGTTIVWLAIAGLGLVSAALSVLTYQLLKQQGRLLLRIEALERELSTATVPVVPAPSNGQHAPRPSAGLPVGASVAPFSLKDLDGQEVALSDFKGKRVLLVHWSPSCGFCEMLAPDLAAVQEKLSSATLQALLVSYGDAETNRTMAQRHGLRLPILLLDGTRIAAFDQLGTPVAYLLDGESTVMRPLALGTDAVLNLAQEAITPARKRLPGEKPLSQSLVLRDGLNPGTRAPRFTLPDLEGRPISLDAYRGRRVLLVFSDPLCGPCNELAPQLASVEQAHENNGLAVVMVGRGDREDNRRKARAHALPFPVVVQEQWKLSKEYGIFATPVAFLIDANGIIERPVAKGKDEIMTLARLAGEREKEPVA